MSVIFSSLPDLPEGVKNGVAARDGTHLYAGLGSAGKRFFLLDLDNLKAGWQSTTDFPGTTRSDAVTITDSKGIWVFSGAGVPENTDCAQVLTDVYFFEFANKSWQRMDTQTPVGLLGACGCEVSTGRFVFFGGYNKTMFDDFCAKMSRLDEEHDQLERQQLLCEFMSKKPQDYGWNQEIIQYDISHNEWTALQKNPYQANCGAGLIWHANTATLIDGEIKPGLRSTEIKQFTLNDENEFSSAQLPSIQSDTAEHEGLAGSYAGVLNNKLVALGGAYFIGSQSNVRQGQWYSHKGLTKHYSNSVWCFDNNRWQVIAEMPIGAAYGSTVESETGLILIGGEDANQKALVSCYLLECS